MNLVSVAHAYDIVLTPKESQALGDFGLGMFMSFAIVGILVTILALWLSRKLYKPLNQNSFRFLSSIILQTLLWFALILQPFWWWSNFKIDQAYSIGNLWDVLSIPLIYLSPIWIALVMWFVAKIKKTTNPVLAKKLNVLGWFAIVILSILVAIYM